MKSILCFAIVGLALVGCHKPADQELITKEVVEEKMDVEEETEETVEDAIAEDMAEEIKDPKSP